MAFGRSGMTNKQVVEKHINEQIREYGEALAASKSKIKDLKGCLNMIAEKVCDGEYGDNQLGGRNRIMALSDYELRDFIINNYNKQRTEYTTSMIKMQQLCAQERADKDVYAKDVLRLQDENQNLKAQINNLEYELQMAKSQLASQSQMQNNSYNPYTNNDVNNEYDSDFDSNDSSDYDNNVPEPLPNHQNRANNQNNQNRQASQQKQNQNRNNGNQGRQNGSGNNNSQNQQGKQRNQPQQRQVQNVQNNQSNNQNNKQNAQQKGNQNSNNGVVYQDGKPFDLNSVLQRTDMLQREVIRIMGETGLNETKEIQTEVLKGNKITNSNKFREVLKLCKDNNLVEETKNPVALRNQLVLNSLSNLGKLVYKKLYNKEPVMDEMSKIIKMHDNLTHGYNIKDTVSTLKFLGYSNVCMDAQKNAIKLPGGSTYIPDVTAEVINADNKKRMKTYWEVELGNHHNNDFFDKMEKAAKVTKELVIIVDKADTKDHVADQINKFGANVKKQNKQITLVIYLGTLKELKDKQLFGNDDNKFYIGSKNKK